MLPDTAGIAVALIAASPAHAQPPEPPRPQQERFVRAHIIQRTQARTSPGGHVLATIGRRTEFGSPRVAYVAQRRGGWLGVSLPERRSGRLAWIPVDAALLTRHGWHIVVDRSRRRLELRRRGRLVHSATIDVGRRQTPTPTGTFSVTDRLPMRRGSPYGCCALALSGHQRAPLPGWRGGDRLAIHGTRTDAADGRASSLGCVRARAEDLRLLMRRVPLGTPVTIRR